MKIVMQPVGHVRTARQDLSDTDWGGVSSAIELVPEMDPEALAGIEDFSHVEVFFVFDRIPEESIEWIARHPRGNTAWPRVGILAQRGSPRPNRMGATICRIVKREGRSLHVVGLDAADDTPVIDLKPVMKEYLPREPTVQPQWASELMRGYWQTRDER